MKKHRQGRFKSFGEAQRLRQTLASLEKERRAKNLHFNDEIVSDGYQQTAQPSATKKAPNPERHGVKLKKA